MVLNRSDVNAILTMFLLAPVVRYSNKVQQPMRATAVLAGIHTRAGLHRLTASRDAPVVCIQKASAPWTRHGQALGLPLILAAKHTADLRTPEP